VSILIKNEKKIKKINKKKKAKGKGQRGGWAIPSLWGGCGHPFALCPSLFSFFFFGFF
jgi:hypothetical protein